MPTVKMRFDLIPLALHGDGDPVDDLGPELLQIAADNARAQAASVLMAQRTRELRECLARLKDVRTLAGLKAGQPASHGLRIPPTTGQAPCFGTERPREVAADQTLSHDPVGQHQIAGGEAHAARGGSSRSSCRQTETARQHQNDHAATGGET